MQHSGGVSQGQYHLPQPSDHCSFDQEMVDFLGCKYTLSAHVQFCTHQYPKSFSVGLLFHHTVGRPEFKPTSQTISEFQLMKERRRSEIQDKIQAFAPLAQFQLKKRGNKSAITKNIKCLKCLSWCCKMKCLYSKGEQCGTQLSNISTYKGIPRATLHVYNVYSDQHKLGPL